MTGSDEPSAASELSSLSGSGFERLGPSGSPAGGSISHRLEPESGEAIAESLKILQAHEEPVLVAGGMTKLESMNPVRDTRILLSCRGLSGIDELDAEDGVVRARSGTPLAEMAAAADRAGWLLPLDPPGEGGTLGGALATGMCGPRRRGFGAVRECVLGLETVLGSGERTRCGARVVKNVTGYDMAKLYVGSFGTLAVIEGAWLRLQPKPRSTRSLALSPSRGDEPFALALEAARRTSARAVALVSADLASSEPGLGPTPELDARWKLMVEFSGDEAVTREDAEWLGGRGPSVPLGPEAIDALGGLQASKEERTLRARIHLLPSALRIVCERLQQAGLRLVVYPEPAVIYAFFEPEAGADPSWLPAKLAVIEEVTARLAAPWVVESLPAWGYAAHDVFMGGFATPLMETLKGRFDPGRILNRGCLIGVL